MKWGRGRAEAEAEFNCGSTLESARVRPPFAKMGKGGVGEAILYAETTLLNVSTGAVEANLPPARFKEVRPTPIIGVAADYSCAIQTWTSSGHALPLFIPTIATGQSDPNLTVYSVTAGWSYGLATGATVVASTGTLSWAPGSGVLTYAGTAVAGLVVGSVVTFLALPQGGASLLINDCQWTCATAGGGGTSATFTNVAACEPPPAAGLVTNGAISWGFGGVATWNMTQTVRWEPQFAGEGVPGPPTTRQSDADGSQYYWAVTYAWALRPFNAATSAAQAALIAKVQRGPRAGWPVPLAPVFERVSDGFMLGMADTNYYPGGANVLAGYGLWTLGTNAPAHELFKGFNTSYADGTYTFVMAPTAAAATSGPPPDYITTEFDCGDEWSPVGALTFTSFLPATYQLVSAPANIADGTIVGVGGTTSNTITSIRLPLSGRGAADYLGNILYTPTAQYAWFQLNGQQPITQLDWSVSWQNRRDATTHQLYLLPGASITIVFAFQRLR